MYSYANVPVQMQMCMFCSIKKAPLFSLDHFRAMGYRIGIDSGPRRNGCRPGEPQSVQRHAAFVTPSSSRGGLEGAALGSTTYPADDVYRARNDYGVRDGE